MTTNKYHHILHLLNLNFILLSPKAVLFSRFTVIALVFLVTALSSLYIDTDNTTNAAYALRQVAGLIELTINPGESKSFEWGIASDTPNDTTTIQLSAKGDGAEFVSFADTIGGNSLEILPSGTVFVTVNITIPVEYPGGITLHPKLYATEFGETGGATVMNIQMLKIPTINVALNEDETLHVDWEEIQLEKQQTTISDDDISVDDEPIPATKDTQQPGFSIIPPEEDSQTKCGPGTELVDGTCQVIEKSSSTQIDNGGGCLIATAAYDTELSPQVQMLRELRDDTLLSTKSGHSFMDSFNAIYYSFSPGIADLQRQYPLLKDTIRVAITPMVSSLSLLYYADIDSEYDMLIYGSSIIALNVVMYIGIPVFAIYTLKNTFVSFYKKVLIHTNNKTKLQKQIM